MQDIFQQMKDRLVELQDAYENQLEEDLSRIDIRDSVISDCLRDQIELQLTWEELHKTIESLCDDLDLECERIFSIAFRGLHSDSYKKLSSTEAKIYAQSDSDYVETKQVKNKAENLKAKVYAIVDSIKTRKFILKNFCDVLRDGNDGYII